MNPGCCSQTTFNWNKVTASIIANISISAMLIGTLKQ